MKRILALVLAAIMCLGVVLLSACSGGGQTTPAASTGNNQKTQTNPTKTNKPDPTSGQTESKTTAEPTAEPTVKPTDTPTETPTPGQYDDLPDYIHPLKREVNTVEHKTADEIPASYSLVGSDFLPLPLERGTDIVNQPADCVTYMQFTNAVARYLYAQDNSVVWKPAEDLSSCFSTKFTGQYAKSVNGNYDILRDNGCLTFAEDDYVRSALKLPIVQKNGKYQTQTTGWKIDEGLAEQTYKYRLVKYEQISTNDSKKVVMADGYFNTITKGFEVSFGPNGNKLMKKIKDAIVTGNVVVTQGVWRYDDSTTGAVAAEVWQLEKLTEASGTAQAGDYVIACSIRPENEDKNWTDAKTQRAYQLCIVGYDDELTYTCRGAEMKGAFLVCNAGDKKWGKNGYAWLMYDSLNTFSTDKNEDGSEKFTLEENEVRMVTLDNFYFMYWDTDITTQRPSLYAEVELETANRGAFSFYMSKIDAYGRTSKIEAYETYHVRINNYQDYRMGDDAEDTTAYFNPAGVLNGDAVNGFYTVSFERFFSNLPVGTDYKNFTYTLQISSSLPEKVPGEATPVTIKSIKWKDSTGAVIKTVVLPEEEVIQNSSVTFAFNFSEDITPDVIVGDFYKFKSVKTGGYMVKDAGMYIKTAEESKTVTPYLFHITYSSKLDRYQLWMKEKSNTEFSKVIDITDFKFADGSKIQFNAENAGTADNPGKRFATQYWGVSYNEDDTVTFYIRGDDGKYYTIGVDDNGKLILLLTTELTDACKWIVEADFTSSYISPVKSTIEKTDAGLKVTGKNLAKDIKKVTVKVYDSTGKEVASVESEVKSLAYTAELPVTAPGQYLVEVFHDTVVNGEEVTLHATNSTIIDI